MIVACFLFCSTGAFAADCTRHEERLFMAGSIKQGLIQRLARENTRVENYRYFMIPDSRVLRFLVSFDRVSATERRSRLATFNFGADCSDLGGNYEGTSIPLP